MIKTAGKGDAPKPAVFYLIPFIFYDEVNADQFIKLWRMNP